MQNKKDEGSKLKTKLVKTTPRSRDIEIKEKVKTWVFGESVRIVKLEKSLKMTALVYVY